MLEDNAAEVIRLCLIFEFFSLRRGGKLPPRDLGGGNFIFPFFFQTVPENHFAKLLDV